MDDFKFNDIKRRFFYSLKESFFRPRYYRREDFKRVIDRFRSRYAFLSNFYISRFYVSFLDFEFLSVEHFYQSMKPFSYEKFLLVKDAASPKVAKFLARKCRIWSEFFEYRDVIMYYGLYLKFKQNEELLNRLLDTKDFYLEEKNYWHDNYFGNCYCKRCRNKRGLNKLGQLLMNLRESFLNERFFSIF